MYGQHYQSRGQAIRAGAWRGAKFAGKWMAAILIVLALVVWAPLIGLIVYRWLWQGIKFWYLVEAAHLGWLPVLRAVGSTVGGIVVGTIWGALIGALIMGVAAAFDYEKPKQRFGIDGESVGDSQT